MNEYEPAASRGQSGTTLADIFAMLGRRKWVFLACVVAFPLAAYLISNAQTPQYVAESKVLLTNQSLASSLTDTPDPNTRIDRDSVVQTQIEIAKLPVIADRAIKDADAKKQVSSDELLANTTVTALGKTFLLLFSVTDSDSKRAVKLANAYATQYTIYRARLDTAAVNRTLREVNHRLSTLGSDSKSDLAGTLKDKQEQLRTLQTLQTSNSVVVRRAQTATQTAPQPSRNAGLALVIGLIVGIALALVLDALDSRLRDTDGIAAAYGAPLLGRVPPQRRRTPPLVVFERPYGLEAEAYGAVLGNIEFAALTRSARTIMAVSASDEEQRSEVVANLGIAFARLGRRVALVDLDSRRPRVSELYGLANQVGVTDVAAGRASLGEACVPIQYTKDPSAANGATAADDGAHGALAILPIGSAPREVISTRALSNLLDQLSELYDVVLLDTPALLRASDAPRLARHADALFVVAGVGSLHSETVREARRALEQTSAAFLGVVTTGDHTAAKLSGRFRAEQWHAGAEMPAESVS